MQAFQDAVDARALQRLGARPFWTARSDDTTSAQLRAQVQAPQCLLSVTGPLFAAADYAGVIADPGGVNHALALDAGQILPCAMQNFDERPRMGVIHQTPPGFLLQGRLANYSDGALRVGLTRLKDWIDARSLTDATARTLTLYAFNEWHEGGLLEPSARDGAARLGIVNDVLQLPQGTHPCRTTGRCPGPADAGP